LKIVIAKSLFLTKSTLQENLLAKEFRSFAVGYGLAVKFGLMLSLPIFASLCVGILLDKKLGTAPWLTLILMLFGLIFATYAVYSVAMREHKVHQNKKEKDV
jgi:F0F1-type ATP synthase assembly protein I